MRAVVPGWVAHLPEEYLTNDAFVSIQQNGSVRGARGARETRQASGQATEPSADTASMSGKGNEQIR
jgi:hypothetical protein